jgi:hypothetical protein
VAKRSRRIFREKDHPRDDRGRFAEKAGGRWLGRVVRQHEAGFGDTSAAQPGMRSGRLGGGVLDLGAISRGNAGFNRPTAQRRDTLSASGVAGFMAQPTKKALTVPKVTEADIRERLREAEDAVAMLDGDSNTRVSRAAHAELIEARQMMKDAGFELAPARRRFGRAIPESEAKAPESTGSFLERQAAKVAAARAAGKATTPKKAVAERQGPDLRNLMRDKGIDPPPLLDANQELDRANNRLARGDDPNLVARKLRDAADSIELRADQEGGPDEDSVERNQAKQSARSLRRAAGTLDGGEDTKLPAFMEKANADIAKKLGQTQVDTSRDTGKTGGVTTDADKMLALDLADMREQAPHAADQLAKAREVLKRQKARTVAAYGADRDRWPSNADQSIRVEEKRVADAEEADRSAREYLAELEAKAGQRDSGGTVIPEPVKAIPSTWRVALSKIDASEVGKGRGLSPGEISVPVRQKLFAAGLYEVRKDGTGYLGPREYLHLTPAGHDALKAADGEKYDRRRVDVAAKTERDAARKAADTEKAAVQRAASEERGRKVEAQAIAEGLDPLAARLGGIEAARKQRDDKAAQAAAEQEIVLGRGIPTYVPGQGARNGESYGAALQRIIKLGKELQKDDFPIEEARPVVSVHARKYVDSMQAVDAAYNDVFAAEHRRDYLATIAGIEGDSAYGVRVKAADDAVDAARATLGERLDAADAARVAFGDAVIGLYAGKGRKKSLAALKLPIVIEGTNHRTSLADRIAGKVPADSVGPEADAARRAVLARLRAEDQIKIEKHAAALLRAKAYGVERDIPHLSGDPEARSEARAKMGALNRQGGEAEGRARDLSAGLRNMTMTEEKALADLAAVKPTFTPLRDPDRNSKEGLALSLRSVPGNSLAATAADLESGDIGYMQAADKVSQFGRSLGGRTMSELNRTALAELESRLRAAGTADLAPKVPTVAAGSSEAAYAGMKRSSLLAIARMKGINPRGKDNGALAGEIAAHDAAQGGVKEVPAVAPDSKRITRAEFDVLPVEQRDRIVAELRKIIDTNDQVSKTIPSNRTSMGTTIRTTVSAPWVEQAKEKLRELTYTAPPPVDYSVGGKASRLSAASNAGEARSILSGSTMADLDDIGRLSGLGRVMTSWKRDKAVDYLVNRAVAGDRMPTDYSTDSIADALRGASAEQALAVLDAIETDRGISKAELQAVATSLGVGKLTGDKRATMHALAGKAGGAGPKAPEARTDTPRDIGGMVELLSFGIDRPKDGYDAHGDTLRPGDIATIGSDRHNRTDEQVEVLDVGIGKQGGSALATVRYANGDREQILMGNLVRTKPVGVRYLESLRVELAGNERAGMTLRGKPSTLDALREATGKGMSHYAAAVLRREAGRHKGQPLADRLTQAAGDIEKLIFSTKDPEILRRATGADPKAPVDTTSDKSQTGDMTPVAKTISVPVALSSRTRNYNIEGPSRAQAVKMATLRQRHLTDAETARQRGDDDAAFSKDEQAFDLETDLRRFGFNVDTGRPDPKAAKDQREKDRSRRTFADSLRAGGGAGLKAPEARTDTRNQVGARPLSGLPADLKVIGVGGVAEDKRVADKPAPPTAEEKAAAKTAKVEAERAAAKVRDEEWTKRRVAEIKRRLDDGQTETLGGVTDAGVLALAREVGVPIPARKADRGGLKAAIIDKIRSGESGGQDRSAGSAHWTGLANKVMNLGSREEAAAEMRDLTIPELRMLANAMREGGVAIVGGTSKAAIIRALVEYAVGRRLDADAISRVGLR